MSASTVALPQPTPAQLARGIAGAVPGELSKSPLLGILGVIIGAGVVTLTSRMISLGLPDFKGHRGFGYDEGAWIGTAFDVGLMFIGPFTVYLGAVIPPRRILLRAAALFTLISVFLPLIHNYALVIVALGLAGLTSGTFYPLTLTFALRNIPLRNFALLAARLISRIGLPVQADTNIDKTLVQLFRRDVSGVMARDAARWLECIQPSARSAQTASATIHLSRNDETATQVPLQSVRRSSYWSVDIAGRHTSRRGIVYRH